MERVIQIAMIHKKSLPKCKKLLKPYQSMEILILIGWFKFIRFYKSMVQI